MGVGANGVPNPELVERNSLIRSSLACAPRPRGCEPQRYLAHTPLLAIARRRVSPYPSGKVVRDQPAITCATFGGWRLAVGGRRSAVGGRRLAVGGWRLGGWRLGGWRLGGWRSAVGGWRLALGGRRSAFGGRRLAFGVWRLAVGVWRLAFGGRRSAIRG
jgi:hypothetical protein